MRLSPVKPTRQLAEPEIARLHVRDDRLQPGIGGLDPLAKRLEDAPEAPDGLVGQAVVHVDEAEPQRRSGHLDRRWYAKLQG